MTPEALAEHLQDKLGDRVTASEVTYGQLTLTVAPAALPDAARVCRQDPAVDCDFFDFLSGVDRKDEGFEVVVHLYSVRHRHHVTLRTLAEGGRDEPKVPTLTGVYRGANWHERETWDMFGISFDGHPGLAPRILTVENFEGWPLRKEFLLSTREVKPWPGAKEPTEVRDEQAAGADSGDAQPALSAEDKAAAAKERTERAKRKAAEMRAKKAAERAAAEETGGGDTEGAAAGTVAGDTSEPPTQDAPGAEQPVEDPDAEARAKEGGPARPGGSPGVTSEGRHADDPSKIPAETPGDEAEHVAAERSDEDSDAEEDDRS